MRSRYTLDVKLTLLGPLLTLGNETATPGVDAPLAADRFGRFMLPFSLVKGKFLDAVTELRSADFKPAPVADGSNRYFPQEVSLVSWLGHPSRDGGYDPERGRLHFSDFHTDQKGRPDNLIERIAIAADSGAVQGRMLQVIQAPFTYGEEVTFQGTIEFFADETEAKQIQSLVDLALRWTPAFGADRTVGFGRTKSVQVDLRTTPLRMKERPSSDPLLPFELILDRPLCLVGRRHSQNHFDSLETISGAVLKGAVAQMIREQLGLPSDDIAAHSPADSAPYSTLRRHFEKLRFLEARPRNAAVEKRPVEPPLSVVTCPVKGPGDHPFFDVALEEKPRLIHGAAPAFLPDWKDADFAAVNKGFGKPLLPRERRTRTAIDPERGRAAEAQLFSYGLVQPDRTTPQGAQEAFVWDGCLDLFAIASADDRKRIIEELAALLQWGIVGLGKTRAVGAITWRATRPPPCVGAKPVGDKQVIVTLQTECLMTNPKTLQDSHQPDPLRAAYCEFWRELSEGRLKLERFFARQVLYGGHVSQRAQKSRNNTYEPFLLTDRESVFVLSIVQEDDAARSLLKDWEAHGLPQPAWVQQRYAPPAKYGAPGGAAPLWRVCPYLRENGYGEIAIDLACHTDNRFVERDAAQGASA